MELKTQSACIFPYKYKTKFYGIQITSLNHIPFDTQTTVDYLNTEHVQSSEVKLFLKKHFSSFGRLKALPFIFKIRKI